MKSEELHIIGAGGSATEIKHAAELVGITVAGLYVNQKYMKETASPARLLEDISDPAQLKMICSVAYTRARARLVKQYRQATFANIVHPSAIFPEYLMGHGCYVGAGVIVSPQVTLGSHVQIHNGAIIGHDTRIADCVTILPGAIIAGNCFIGYQSVVGAGAKIREKITVGAGAIVGMGAVVIQDVREGTMVAGVPAIEIVMPASPSNGSHR